MLVYNEHLLLNMNGMNKKVITNVLVTRILVQWYLG